MNTNYLKKDKIIQEKQIRGYIQITVQIQKNIQQL